MLKSRGKRGRQCKGPPNPQPHLLSRSALSSLPSPPSKMASSPHLYPWAFLPAPFPTHKDEIRGTCAPVQALATARVLRAPTGLQSRPQQPHLRPPLHPCSPGTILPPPRAFSPAVAASPAQPGPAEPQPASGPPPQGSPGCWAAAAGGPWL